MKNWRIRIEKIIAMPVWARFEWVFNIALGFGVWGTISTITKQSTLGILPALIVFIILTALHEVYLKKKIKESEALREQERKEYEERLDNERKNYQRDIKTRGKILANIVMNLDVRYRYKKLAFIYFIGETPSQDSWTRHYIIYAEEDLFLLKDIVFGSKGEKVPGQRTFADLQIRSYAAIGEVQAIPTEDGDEKQWKGALFILPPLRKGEQREFTLNGLWPGLWNDLRATGEDMGDVRLTRPAEILDIIMVFPHNIGYAELKVPPNRGNITKERDAQGRLQLIWHIVNADATQYDFRVICPAIKNTAPSPV